MSILFPISFVIVLLATVMVGAHRILNILKKQRNPDFQIDCLETRLIKDVALRTKTMNHSVDFDSTIKLFIYPQLEQSVNKRIHFGDEMQKDKPTDLSVNIREFGHDG